ncbi:uncharacterized protein METZ01_LOCUS214150 [marine metagenome]|uniref:Uncharacterized protein n=1 Tax=marine metagenome TaxID=408172 RepID=A0A382FDY5_9ZZZZ
MLTFTNECNLMSYSRIRLLAKGDLYGIF